MRRYALRDDQWDRIKDFLPGREGHVGGTAADNRLFVEAVLYRYRTGIPWRDLPVRFGDWKIVHQRFGRWANDSSCHKAATFIGAWTHKEESFCDIVVIVVFEEHLYGSCHAPFLFRIVVKYIFLF